MLLKLYSKDGVYLRAISDYKNLRITEELETGYKIAQFQLPYSISVVEEMKIEIDNYLYVIKEVNMQGKGLYDVYCKPFFSALVSVHIDSLVGTGMTIQAVMDKILTNTQWTYIVEPDVTGSLQIDMQFMTVLDIINTLAPLYGTEVEFDTKKRIIHFYNKRQKYAGAWVLNFNNLRDVKVQSNTYDMVTRLIPLGYNNLNIRNVNNGQPWVEDYSYTDEILVGYYINTDVENENDLLKIAKQEIKNTAQPQTTYRVYLSEFRNDIAVGDEVKVIDNIKGIKQKKRVQKIVRFPGMTEKSYLELGNPEVSFDKIYKDLYEMQASSLKRDIQETKAANTETDKVAAARQLVR